MTPKARARAFWSPGRGGLACVCAPRRCRGHAGCPRWTGQWLRAAVRHDL